MANKGTLFLDEVENMPMPLQKKLLRVLEVKEVEMLGDSKSIPVDIRIIAATNKSLWSLVTQGTFREDLFHRLNVISLEIPPLRSRRNDILLLSEFFLEEFRKSFFHPVKVLSSQVKEVFLQYPWPGNVRELKNAIEHGICMCEKEELETEHLPSQIRSWKSEQEKNTMDSEKELLSKLFQEYGFSEQGKMQVANILKISRSTLYRKIKKYQL